MFVAMTNDEFLERVKSIHGDRFDYSNVKYISTKKNVIIIDSDLIEYSFYAQSLLEGSVPTIKSAINKNKAFEVLARKVHGDKYDYSESVYINRKCSVNIICKIHGLFTQNVGDHLNGCGCNFCNAPKKQLSHLEFMERFNSLDSKLKIISKYKSSNNKILVEDEYNNQFLVNPLNILNGAIPDFGTSTNKNKLFISKANLVHNNIYQYDNSKYTTSTNKVEITCSIHGNFKQSPANHLQGHGCPYCSETQIHPSVSRIDDIKILLPDLTILGEYKTRMGNVIVEDLIGIKYLVSFNQLLNSGMPTIKSAINKNTAFAIKSNIVHNNKYNYDKVDYKRSNIKVLIGCPNHGYFLQSPSDHLQNHGCPECKSKYLSELNKIESVGFTLTKWVEKSKTSPRFDSYKVYILKCTGLDEEFIKIGRTFTTVKNRYKAPGSMPYEYEIIAEISDNAYRVYNLENKLKRILKNNRHTVNIKFDGMYECFNINSLELIKDYI